MNDFTPIRAQVSAADGSQAAAKTEACDTVLRERGQREVFCGLTSIVWLHR